MKSGALIVVLLAGTLLAAPALASAARQASPHATMKPERSASVPPGLAGSPSRQMGEDNDGHEQLGLLIWCMSALADGNFRDAQKACGRAIKLDRWNPAPYKLRGASYLLEKRYEQARVDFADATRLDPTDAENHAGYAEAFRGQGKYREAIAEFSVAIRLAPNDPRMWNARCWTRGAFARDLAEGLSDCNRALRLAPGQSDVLDSRGLVYLRMGKLDNAARDFSAALRKRPNLATALYGRGVARMKHGDVKGAQADILAARRVDPNVDDIFFWRPLLSQRCLTGIVSDHGWKCRPFKPRVKKAPGAARTAAAR
ncbi:MAG TPA: tetratricopeptide repeat protein [Rhizomicrobium sp.]|nr:tetratricopeptide repeat protein [Rhizomicrobium sp.]